MTSAEVEALKKAIDDAFHAALSNNNAGYQVGTSIEDALNNLENKVSNTYHHDANKVVKGLFDAAYNSAKNKS